MAKNTSKIKPYLGFILHAGYVEDSCVGIIPLRHMDGGFDTLNESLVHLSHYLFDALYADYKEGQKVYIYDLDNLDPLEIMIGYVQFLRGLGTSTADTWDSFHANDEQYWPWEHLHENYNLLGSFWENTESLHDILPQYLDAGRFQNIELGDEIISLQDKPKDEFNAAIWERNRSAKVWKCVAGKKKA